jgi:homoserine kinase type II
LLREHLNTIDPRCTRWSCPFAVPWPLPTRQGRTWTAAPDGAIVSLTPAIEGAVPDSRQRVVAQSLGETVALLDEALARLTAADPTTFVPPRLPELPGDSVPEDVAVLTQHPRDVQRTFELLPQVHARIPHVYSELQDYQLLHNDFVPANVLMLGTRVTGVLDFEFTSVDLRAVGLAAALVQCCLLPAERHNVDAWPLLEAFLQAHMRTSNFLSRPWTAGERRAIPDFIRYREVVVFLHWHGRWRSGVSAAGAAANQLQEMLQLDSWLIRQLRPVGQHAVVHSNLSPACLRY